MTDSNPHAFCHPYQYGLAEKALSMPGTASQSAEARSTTSTHWVRHAPGHAHRHLWVWGGEEGRQAKTDSEGIDLLFQEENGTPPGCGRGRERAVSTGWEYDDHPRERRSSASQRPPLCACCCSPHPLGQGSKPA